jgi:predicted SprT family Zn-dependent metalloprotease
MKMSEARKSWEKNRKVIGKTRFGFECRCGKRVKYAAKSKVDKKMLLCKDCYIEQSIDF